MFADNDNHAITDGHSNACVNELCWEFYDSVNNDLYLMLVLKLKWSPNIR